MKGITELTVWSIILIVLLSTFVIGFYTGTWWNRDRFFSDGWEAGYDNCLNDNEDYLIIDEWSCVDNESYVEMMMEGQLLNYTISMTMEGEPAYYCCIHGRCAWSMEDLGGKS